MPRKTDSLPHSDQCEKGILGAYMANPDKVHDKCVFRGVTDKWFHEADNGRLFAALTEMREKGLFLNSAAKAVDRPCYLVPVTQYCFDNDKRLNFDHSDLAFWITEIWTQFSSTASNIDYYINLVQEKAAHRFGLVAAMNLVEQLKHPSSLQEVSDLLSGAFAEAKELCSVSEHRNWKKEEMMGFLEEMEGLCQRGEKPDVMPFFFPSIDEEVGGIKPGELCIVLGLSSTGKSLVAMRFALLNAVHHNRKAAVFTFEMPTRQYIKRATAALGKVSLLNMRDGRFKQHEFNLFMNAQIQIEKAPIDFYDVKRCTPTPKKIEAAIRRHKKNHGLDMVVIDHLNLVKFSSKSESRRDQELSSFADDMKLLAQELDFAAIVLAQSNKEGQVFDSTQVESAADFSFALTPTYKKIGGISKVDGTDGIWINKMREGRRGWKINLKMTGEFATIEETIV